MLRTAGSLFLYGVLFGSGPCMASCGPLLVSYSAATRKDFVQGLVFYLFFSLAKAIVYTVLGTAVFALGRYVLERLPGTAFKYASVGIGAAVAFTGALIPFRETRGCERGKAFALGAALALLPCAPLLGVLSYVAMISPSWSSAFFYTASFGIGTLLSPLLLLTACAGVLPRSLLKKKTACARVFTYLSSAAVIVLGLRLVARAF